MSYIYAYQEKQKHNNKNNKTITYNFNQKAWTDKVKDTFHIRMHKQFYQPKS